MRSAREDLIPGYQEPGLHIIVEAGGSSPFRKLLPQELPTEEVSLLELRESSVMQNADRIQVWKKSGQRSIVFVRLDNIGERRLADTEGPPPRTTPSHALRDLLPVILQEAADSICYVTKEGLVLAIKHTRLPADVYYLNGEEEKKR